MLAVLQELGNAHAHTGRKDAGTSARPAAKMAERVHLRYDFRIIFSSAAPQLRSLRQSASPVALVGVFPTRGGHDAKDPHSLRRDHRAHDARRRRTAEVGAGSGGKLPGTRVPWDTGTENGSRERGRRRRERWTSATGARSRETVVGSPRVPIRFRVVGPKEPSMARRLEGAVAVVPGASRGIGRATARLFAQRDARGPHAEGQRAPSRRHRDVRIRQRPALLYRGAGLPERADVPRGGSNGGHARRGRRHVCRTLLRRERRGA